MCSRRAEIEELSLSKSNESMPCPITHGAITYEPPVFLLNMPPNLPRNLFVLAVFFPPSSEPDACASTGVDDPEVEALTLSMVLDVGAREAGAGDVERDSSWTSSVSGDSFLIKAVSSTGSSESFS